MTRTLSCRAMLFDMDGTLVDSTQAVEDIWGRWALRHGFKVEEILKVSHGRRTVDTLRDVAPHIDIETEAAELERQEIVEREGVVEVPGAAVLLAQLPLNRWAVVTSASRPLAEARLTAAGLPIPSVLISASDVREGKPDPEGYLLAASRLKTSPLDCVVLEDTPAGLAAGRAAGMRVLALTTTFSRDELNEPLTVADFLNLRISVIGEEIHIDAA
jgi:mannitol-1-/sugar-/sorbitol-6-phosphatase